MRTQNHAFFAIALALTVSACGAPDPMAPMDGGTPTQDVVNTPDVPIVATDDGNVTPPVDTGTPGPTNTDLPPGMPYNPGPGGNAGIPCQDNLRYDRWRFAGNGSADINGAIAGGLLNEMWRLTLENSRVPMAPDAPNWVYSVGTDGTGRYWNNFGRMPTGVHCWMRVNEMTCDSAVIECFDINVDPRTGGMPMQNGTLTARRLGDG